jgi:AcrR family transcriptional regulator
MKQVFFQLSPEKRDAIVRASISEFGEQDFDAASLERIVIAAGITQGGLDEYISSKEDLYIFCMEKTWSSLYRFITERVSLARTPLPSDILARFMTVSQIAIEWYLENPSMLGLIVRTSSLPREVLAKKAESVFERHFSELFSGLDTLRLAYPLQQLVDLIKCLLAKSRKDVLLEMSAGKSPDEVRRFNQEEWTFFCALLSKGMYR